MGFEVSLNLLVGAASLRGERGQGDVESEGAEGIGDVRGGVVAELTNGRQNAGTHVATWNGCDEDGRRVAAGVYVVELRIEGIRQAFRLIRLE